MKKNIHPKYYANALVTCSCGNKLEVASTVPAMKIEVCSACHPYYTGKQKLIDAAGRIDQFKKRLAKAEISRNKAAKKLIPIAAKPAASGKKSKKAGKPVKRSQKKK